MLRGWIQLFGFKPGNQVDPEFRPALRSVIATLRSSGYSVTVNSLYRSSSYQQELHRRWEEGDPSIIAEPAPPGESAHNYGMAADLDLDPPDIDVLGDVAEMFGLTWGGFEDPVHVELSDWRGRTGRWDMTRLIPL